MTAPIAKKVPAPRTVHGDTVVDNYEWLREKDNAEVIAFLEGQNAATDADTAELAGLRSNIFTEIKSRTKETDMSVPVRHGAYWYYTRTVAGQQYALRCRCPVGDAHDWAPPTVGDDPLPGEYVMLDSNVDAQGHDFYSLGAFTVSDDAELLAYSTDVVGDERYTLRLKNLDSGELLNDVIANTAPGAVISADSKHVFYLTVDDAWRPDTVWRHDIGAETDDIRVFHEPDERYWVGMGTSRSEKYLVIGVGSKITSENFVLESSNPTGEFRSVWPRREGIEYDVEHAVVAGDDYFVITHNDGAENFAVAIAPVNDPMDHRVLVEHNETSRIEGVDTFANHMVLSYRRDATSRISLADLTDIADVADIAFSEVEFSQQISTAGLSANPEWDSPRLRIGYTSFIEPAEIFDLDLATGDRILLRRQPVLGNYDPADYEQRREWVTAADGTRVPLSIVSRVGVQRPAPTLLYGYGSYEASMDPGFSIARLSLLDRGVVFVIAHVRGGGELGRRWYDTGKTLTKKNTFTDFVDAAQHLIDTGATTAKQLVGEGGSAGGLLIGAVANMAPQLFNGILAVVPFVDPLTSILDPSLPLTVIEWDEWGNPLDSPEVYAYMKSYSPYENVVAQDYPSILAITSLNDTRVLFTEAAKWVARLQDYTTGERPILLRTEMSAGHGGVSGRYKQWEEVAFEHAWVLRETGAVSI